MNDFPLADEDDFNGYINRIISAKSGGMKSSEHNICPDCPDSLMVVYLSEYKCNICGRTEPADITELDVMSYEYRSSNRNVEYARTQREAISKMLRENNDVYNGDKFQKDILEDVADQYNAIQVAVKKNVYDADGNISGKKNYVKRSNVKNEIIAALISFECNRRKLPRKAKDIATFMQLSNDGFSAGEDELRRLNAEGLIDITIEEEPYSGFALRYLDTLEIDKRYIDFVTEVIAIADQRKIGLNSLPPSKVAGCIWLIVSSLKIDINIDRIENACDNTKKNTFIKFYNAIMKNEKIFRSVMQRYNL